MKKLYLFFLISSLFLFVAFSEPSLREVSEALGENKITRGDFSLERFSAKTDRTLKSSGKFTIATEYGMIWFTESPVKTTQVVTKEFMLTENSRGKRNKVEGAENKIYSTMATLTSALFSGAVEQAEQNAEIRFSYQALQSDDDDSYSWQAELFPNDASIKAMLEKIIVTGKYESGVCVATSMQLVFADKNTTTYLLSNHQFYDVLSDDEAEFFIGNQS